MVRTFPALLVVVLVAGCGGAQAPRRWRLGEEEMSRAALLTVAALSITHQVCSSGEVRGCLEVDDAGCVRLVGDAVIQAEPYDRKVIPGVEQAKWIETTGARAAHNALLLAPVRPACRPLRGPIQLGEIRALGTGGREEPCVRLAGDDTPCGRPDE